jgi:hypothetical protein
MSLAGSSQHRDKAGSSSRSTGPAQALCEACAAWNASEVAKLLEAGADPNAADTGGVTPLYACFTSVTIHNCKDTRCWQAAVIRNIAWTGHLEECTLAQEETVQLLLQHGANPCLPSVGRDTPLMAAAACSTKLLGVLLEAAGVDTSTRSSSSSDGSGRRPGDACPPGGRAGTIEGPPSTSLTGSSSIPKSASCSPECSSSLEEMGEVLTNLACVRGCPKAVQLLLDCGLVWDVQGALKQAVHVGLTPAANGRLSCSTACLTCIRIVGDVLHLHTWYASHPLIDVSGMHALCTWHDDVCRHIRLACKCARAVQ